MDLELKRQLECPICLNNYISPRILTKCGHTICENCLNLLLKSNEFAICPLCHTKSYFKKEEGIESFKLNYSLMGIIDNINEFIHENKKQNINKILSKSVPDNFNYFNKNINIIDFKEIDEIESIDNEPIDNNLNCCCAKRK